MSKGFLTAPYINQAQDKTPKLKQTSQLPLIKKQIANVVSKMPHLQVCYQAALNLGLNEKILNFQKIMVQIQNSICISHLKSLYTQFKSLLKQTLKLKKSILNADYTQKNCQQNQARPKNNRQILSKRIIQKNESEINLKQAVQKQLYYRALSKKHTSTQKIDRKQIQLKKTSDKARDFNKKVQKIFQAKRQNQQMILNNHVASAFLSVNTSFLKDKNDGKQHIHKNISKCDSLLLINQTNDTTDQTNKFFNKQRSSQNISRHRSAVNSFYLDQFKMQKNLQKKLKFEKYKKRENQVYQNKLTIQKYTKENVLRRLILKHQRNTVQKRVVSQIKTESQQKLFEKNKQIFERILKNNQQRQQQLATRIQEKCLETQNRKDQLILQKVFLKKQNQKLKQQKQQESYAKKQSHQFNIHNHLNQKYLKTCSARFSKLKETEKMHQQIVASRHVAMRQKENNNQMEYQLNKMSEKALNQILANIKTKEQFNSIF